MQFRSGRGRNRDLCVEARADWGFKKRNLTGKLVRAPAYSGAEGACGVEERPRLIGIRGDRGITKETDPEFWFQCQRAILLGLKEAGALSEAQYRLAEEQLKQTCRRESEKRGEKLP